MNFLLEISHGQKSWTAYSLYSRDLDKRSKATESSLILEVF